MGHAQSRNLQLELRLHALTSRPGTHIEKMVKVIANVYATEVVQGDHLPTLTEGIAPLGLA